MRQAIFAIATLATLTLAATTAYAGPISVDVAYTADDKIMELYLLDDSSTLTDLSSKLTMDAVDWRKVDKLTMTGLDAETTYQLIFLVINDTSYQPGGKYNPAELLVEISGTDLTGDLVSSKDWDTAKYDDKGPGDTGFSFSGLTWSSAVESYKNGDTTGAKNMLTIGGPLTGISSDAYWIWSSGNATSSMDNALWLRGSFTTSEAPVPEPASMALIGLGVAGFAVSRRRARRRAA